MWKSTERNEKIYEVYTFFNLYQGFHCIIIFKWFIFTSIISSRAQDCTKGKIFVRLQYVKRWEFLYENFTGMQINILQCTHTNLKVSSWKKKNGDATSKIKKNDFNFEIQKARHTINGRKFIRV
jgi:hypothetical protein